MTNSTDKNRHTQEQKKLSGQNPKSPVSQPQFYCKRDMRFTNGNGQSSILFQSTISHHAATKSALLLR